MIVWVGKKCSGPIAACQDEPDGALGTGLHPGWDNLLHYFGAIITANTDKLVQGPLPCR